MRILKHSILVLMGTASLASAATLINVDFGLTGGTAGTYNGTPAPVLGNNGDIWNGVTSPSGVGKTVSNAPLNFVDGSASGVTVSVTAFDNASDLSGTSPYNTQIGATYKSLMADYIYLYTVQSYSSATITLKGLPASSTGSIVLFAADTAGQGSSFTIGGTTLTTTDPNGHSIATNGLVAGVDYVEFNNVTSDATGQLSISWTVPGTQQFAALNGMQIQFVPEPSAALLGGVGMLGLLTRRRRRYC
jgi:hypothetical protein